MGIQESVLKVSDMHDQLRNALHALFEPQLKRADLAEAQIEFQSLPELRQSLERIEQAIEKPEQFGALKLKISSQGFVIVTTTSDYHLEIGPLSTLLARKKMILDCIHVLEGEVKIDSLRELIGQVPVENTREILSAELLRLESELEKWQAQAKELEKDLRDSHEAVLAEQMKIHGELLQQIKQKDERLEQIESERNRKDTLLRWTAGFLIFFLSVTLLLVIPNLLSWGWVLQHPRKMGLTLAAIASLFGLSWAIVENNGERRKFALGTIAIAAIIQIIGIVA